MPGFLIPQTSASPLTITDVFVVNSEAAMLALSSAQVGDVAIRTDQNKSYILSSSAPGTLSNWKELLSPPDAVSSVDGQTGVVNLSSTYQPVDGDLTALSALSGTGFIKRTGTDTYALDTNTYLTTSGGTLSGNLNISGTLDANEIRETVVDVTLSSNLGTLDWTAGNIYYIATAPTASMTFNVTNVPTDNSKMMSVGVLVTQGATGYIPTTFQIGGASQTIRWSGGTAPTPTSSAGKIDIFSFTMQRTSGGSWIVYGTSSLGF